MKELTARWSFAISTRSYISPSSLPDHRTIETAIALATDQQAPGVPEPIASAVRYALAGGGKRLRGMLFLAAYRAAGGTGDASGIAASIEMIHAYSLVHDDLPCMDDDDMRRGRQSTHCAFTVPVATAAGAVMIPIAARTAYAAARDLRLPDTACGTIVKVLMQGAGAGGMIGGQLLDLAGEDEALTREALDSIHSAKTGALIAAAVKLGGIAACADPPQLQALEGFGERIGLAFQIMDDVLDVTASSHQLGKTAGRDAALGKSTYPALLGVDGAVSRANNLIAGACDALRIQGLLTVDLENLAELMVSRSH
ncbi:MAG TPA: polyprenyl synthetase family protein [Gemmatimonadaceae bacterium]|nr:polyprenyl synthetase family protein [Gemmatimonadaceae bacterium]